MSKNSKRVAAHGARVDQPPLERDRDYLLPPDALRLVEVLNPRSSRRRACSPSTLLLEHVLRDAPVRFCDGGGGGALCEIVAGLVLTIPAQLL